jgi:hypothetical protein
MTSKTPKERRSSQRKAREHNKDKTINRKKKKKKEQRAYLSRAEEPAAEDLRATTVT